MTEAGLLTTTEQSPTKNWSFPAIWAIAIRPTLWTEGVLGLISMTRRGRVPERYVSWRATTAYGHQQPVTPEDLVEYLVWRKRMRRLT